MAEKSSPLDNQWSSSLMPLSGRLDLSANEKEWYHCAHKCDLQGRLGALQMEFRYGLFLPHTFQMMEMMSAARATVRPIRPADEIYNAKAKILILPRDDPS
jgi:hypothetical protein